MDEIEDATGRISTLVAAVKQYSYMDTASVQEIDVLVGLDSTVVMLGHKLAGVTVVKDYAADAPHVPAYPAELNQVWTNLIDNAVQAMDGTGHADVADQGRRRPRSWSRWATTAPGSPRTSSRGCGRPSSPPRARARAAVSAWRRSAASSSAATTARSGSPPATGRDDVLGTPAPAATARLASPSAGRHLAVVQAAAVAG